MKYTRAHKSQDRGVTLVELLVVISIIAVLAGLVVPAIARAKVKAKVTAAVKDIGDIGGAIAAYKGEYSRLPSSSTAQAAANAATATRDKDFIYGSFGVAGYSGGGNILAGTGYEANNSELMLILTATQQFPTSTNNVNFQHAKNMRKTVFLNAKQVTATKPGIGPDGVFRDPFLQPYIITLDLDYDGFVAPAVYRLQAVSQQQGTAGFNGLLHRDPVGTPTGNSDDFGLRNEYAIWSLGPDGKFAATLKANASGVIGGQRVDNSDNILSWK